MKHSFNKNSIIFSDLLPLLVIVLCVVVVTVTYHPEKATYMDETTALDSGWVTDDGQRFDIDELPKGDITVTHTLTGIDLYRKRFCFRSADTHITAVFDGEEFYSYAPEFPPVLGRSYGMYIHMIPIPPEAQTVTLKLHPLYDNLAPYLRYAAVEDAGVFMGDIYHQNLPGFALCVIIALFGVLMLILGFTARHTTYQSDVNFFSLGTFSILVGVWSANDTYIIQVFTQHPELMRFTNYLCLIFIAYLPVSIMAKATNNSGTVMLPILFLLTTLNFVITMLLSALEISDVRLMLPFSHFNIIVAMVMTMILMVRSVRKKTIDRRFLHMVIVGMTCAVIGVAADILRFRLFPDSSLASSTFTRIGVLVFIVLMGRYLMQERTKTAAQQGQTELMRKLAYTDGLTELANRSAFHLKEDELRQTQAECVIVQLDINFLKKVNDVYGHAEGDKHIIGAANIIRECFDGLGSCYRVGGDEFVVVAANCTEQSVCNALNDLEKKTAEYNTAEAPPVAMQIAHGYALYDGKSCTLEEAEKLADQRMYEKKKAMKNHAAPKND